MEHSALAVTWPHTSCVVKDDLELLNEPASTSQALGLQTDSTTPSSQNSFCGLRAMCTCKCKETFVITPVVIFLKHYFKVCACMYETPRRQCQIPWTGVTGCWEILNGGAENRIRGSESTASVLTPEAALRPSRPFYSVCFNFLYYF